MLSILDETIPIGRTNEWDLQLRDVQLRLYCTTFLRELGYSVDSVNEY